MYRELEMQSFNMLIASAEMFGDGFEEIDDLRFQNPLLVVIAEVASSKRAEMALACGADHVLHPSVSRSGLIECLDAAYRSLLVRTFNQE